MRRPEQRIDPRRRARGFTLTELMIVVAIVAIIAAIGYPNYVNYVNKGKRSEGRSALLDTAARLERFYSDNNRYATVANTFPAGVACAGACTTTATGSGYYNITVATAGTFQTFTLTATPTYTESDCGALTLNQAGATGQALGTTELCWGK